jgi:hypothetical protein
LSCCRILSSWSSNQRSAPQIKLRDLPCNQTLLLTSVTTHHTHSLLC